MSTYVFKAMDLAGAPMRGQVDAESKQAVSDQLQARGLVILDIAESTARARSTSTSSSASACSDLAIFSRQLATMVSSGMTILRALFVLEEQTEVKLLAGDDRHGPQGRRGRPRVQRGARRAPEGLQPAVRVDGARRRDRRRARGLADAHRRPAREGGALRRQVRSAMVYPRSSSPSRCVRDDRPGRLHRPRLRRRAQAVRHQHGRRSLPAMTQITVDFSHASPIYWCLHRRRPCHRPPASVAGRARSGAAAVGHAPAALPMKIGDIVQKIAIARWSRTFSALTAPACRCSRRSTSPAERRQRGRREAMPDVVDSVKRGGTIADPLKKSPVFPHDGQPDGGRR